MADDDAQEKPKHSGGKPTKLTTDTVGKIITAIRAGNYPRVAAQLSGISMSCYEQWMQRGEAAAPGDERYVEFRNAVHRAEAELQSTVTAMAMKNVAKNHKDAIGFLERRFPKDWAKREQHDHSGTIDHRVGVVMMPPIEALPQAAVVQVLPAAPKQLEPSGDDFVEDTVGASPGTSDPVPG